MQTHENKWQRLMSTSKESEKHTLCVGSMLRMLQLKDTREVPHSSLPSLTHLSIPCTAPCFAQTSSAHQTSVLMKSYSSCLTLPGQPHRSKERICGKRLLSQFLLLLYFCLMINSCKINAG